MPFERTAAQQRHRVGCEQEIDGLPGGVHGRGTSWKLNPLGLNAVDLNGSLSLRRHAASINVARADLTPCTRGLCH
jgi:hypothetical protein